MELNNEAVKSDCMFITCAAKAVPVENGPAKLIFQGYSGDAVDVRDYGFDYPLVYNIQGIQPAADKIPIMLNHRETIGHTTSIRKVDNGSAVRGKGIASLPGEATTRVVEGVKNGFPWQASMGLKIPDIKKDLVLVNAGTVKVNNREFKAPIYVANRTILKEMTVCEFGRDSNTSFEYINEEDRMYLKNAAGSPPVQKPDSTTVTDSVKTETRTVENTETKTVENTEKKPETTQTITNSSTNDKPTEQTVENNQNWSPAQYQTMARYMKLCRENVGFEEIIENGMAQGMDEKEILNRVNLERLNRGLPIPPRPNAQETNTLLNKLEARMCLSFGVKPEFLENHMDKRLVGEAADSRQMTMGELMVTIANAQGGRFTGYDDIEVVCDFIKNVGYSTFDLPDFFKKIGSIMKEERWAMQKPFAVQFCKEGSNKDFRKTVKKRITGGNPWTQVDDAGKIDLWTAGDQVKYEADLETYGALFVYTRQEAANDEMDVLTDMMNMMVEGAMMIPDIQFGSLIIDAADGAAGGMWTANSNSFSNLAFNRTNVSARYNSLRTILEKKGKINWSMMTNEQFYLLHSPLMAEKIWELLAQTVIVGNTTANTIQGQKNYWAGKFEPVEFPQMANTSVFKSGSKWVGDATWILWPKSDRFSPLEITYYRGQKKPVIKSVDMPASLLGFGTQGYWDVKLNVREKTLVQRMTETA